MSADWEVQKALYEKLNADASLGALITAIYDFAPQETATFPYIEIGRIISAEMDTKTRNGFDFVARVHTWSRSGSIKETKDIQGAIYAALHLQGLNITGFNTILLRRETSDVMRASSGAFHGVCEYRGLIDQT